MLPPPGYTLAKCLHTTRRSEVYAAVRDADGREVVLKSYASEQLERAQRELEALRRAAGPGVIAALELDRTNPQPVLVLERARGMSLSSFAQAPLDAQTFLRVAIALADALARIHAARIVHKDIKPSNIVIDPDTLELAIVDFELAADLGAADAQLSVVEGSLPYIAPEQTGRINHGVDFRSDLYSLGATFHHLLTSQPPFSGSPRDVIHAHLAVPPPSPALLRPELPSTLSRIVLKLMQKQPESRYQSARALHIDLCECLAQYERTSAIDEFPLGRSDEPCRPSFPRALFGREREIAQLNAAFERVSDGASACVLLRGLPGMGKTALVDELRARIAERGGYLAWGKFDLYRRDVPYLGVRAALESLVHQWLAEDDTRLVLWREALKSELGAIAAALVDLTPDFATLLERDLPRAPLLGPSETRTRLSLAVERVLQVATREAPPLVLVLDDLQWADAASLSLLEDILSAKTPSLLVVGTYRSQEVSADHPVTELLGRLAQAQLPPLEIQVDPVSTEAAAELLARALGRTPERTLGLAERIAVKTGNSPLLIQQFVLHMHALGYIRYAQDRGWVWDEMAIAGADVPDGAVGLMIAKLERLPVHAREALQLASCVADEFSVELLSELCNRDRAQLESGLWVLSEEGLIAPSRNGFRFAHDRIREAAQELLSDVERQRIHGEAARLLLERTPDAELEERVLEIADHLNQASAQSLDEPGRVRALELNVRAGKHALLSGAAATACRYFAAGQRLLRDADWQERPALAFELLMRHIEGCFQTRARDIGLGLVAALERRPLNRLQQAQVAAKRISFQLGNVILIEGPRLVLQVLRRFGVRWPLRPSQLRVQLTLLWTDWVLRGSLEDDTFRPADMARDSDWLAPVIVMGAGASTLALNSPRLVCLLSAYCLRAYRHHGHIGSPAMALAAYAASHHAHLPRLGRAERYAAAAEKWCTLSKHPVYRPRAELVLSLYYAWTRPRRSLVEPLRRIAASAREVGDLEYFTLALFQRLNLCALVGEPLERVQQVDQNLREFLVRLVSPSWAERSIRLLVHGELIPSPPPPAVPDAGLRVSGSEVRRWPFSPFWMTALCCMGAYDEAYRSMPQVAAARLSTGSDSSMLVDLLFFRGVAAAELAGQNPAMRAYRKDLRECARRVRGYARRGPDFVHMALLLDAEQARLDGREKQCLERYASAAERALGHGYRHHAALVFERQARYLQQLRRDAEALPLLNRAAALYADWGAQAKVAALRGELTQLEQR
jgi:hypothetical protein